MPFLLLAVLRECREQDQLLKVGFQLRDNASELREWSALMDEETDLGRYIEEFSDVERLAESLIPERTQPDTKSTLQIGLSPSVTNWTV